MRVAEIKSLAPLAAVYELKPECHYLLIVPPDVDPRELTHSLRGLFHGVLLVAEEPEQLRLFAVGA